MCLFFNSKYDFENIIHQPDFFGGGVSIQKSMDPILEEYAKKSIEFASKWHFPSIIIESLMLKKSQNTNRIQQFFFSFPDMGNRLAASGQYEKAVKCFTEAIKFNPKEFK